MDFYAGNMSLLNDIAQIENDAGPSGSETAPALPDPKDTHRSTQTQMALFGLTMAWNEAYNPAITQVNPSTFISRPSRKSSPAEPNPISQSTRRSKRIEAIFAKYPIASA
jgi:hypothetical protein